MKIATICSGIGAPESALNLLKIPYELAYFCEFDKYAAKSYCAIHNEPESKNIGDLTKVDIGTLPKDLDLIVGGTPCQDFSLAGKGAGGEVDSGTRSSLMWNFVEIIRQTTPKAVIWENVKGAMSEKNRANYDKFISALRQLGYKVTPTVDNAKNFCCPQNRERIFVMAGQHYIEPPLGYDCGIRLKDVLESKVDDKYYLSEKAIKYITSTHDKYKVNINSLTFNRDIACCKTAKEGMTRADSSDYIKEPKCEVVGNLDRSHEASSRIYGTDGLSPTVDTMTGGGREPKIIDNTQNFDGIRQYNKYSPTLRSERTGLKVIKNCRIRKLTPLECWRLMRFTDEQFHKAQAVNSNSQLYKQAGNSMVVSHIAAVIGEYYGIDWKPLVFGEWHKTETELLNELPLMQWL